MKKKYFLLLTVFLLIVFGFSQFKIDKKNALTNIIPKTTKYLKTGSTKLDFETTSKNKKDTLIVEPIDEKEINDILKNTKSIEGESLKNIIKLEERNTNEKYFTFQNKSIYTKTFNTKNQILRKHIENPNVKQLILPLEGSLSRYDRGFIFDDFSHGEGCSFNFYDFNLNLLNSFTLKKCYESSLMNLNNDIKIIIQEKHGDDKVNFFLLSEQGNILREKRIFVENDELLKLYTKSSSNYILKILGGEYVLDYLDDNFTLINSFELGFVSFNKLEFDDFYFYYINKDNLIKQDIKTGEIVWVKKINNIQSFYLIENNEILTISNDPGQSTINIINMNTGNMSKHGHIPKILNVFDLKIYNIKDFIIVKVRKKYFKITI